MLPLLGLWDCGSKQRLVEELRDGFVEDWSSQSEEPSWESVKSCGSVMKAIEEFKHMPFRDVLELGKAGDLLAEWLGIDGVGGDSGVVGVE